METMADMKLRVGAAGNRAAIAACLLAAAVMAGCGGAPVKGTADGADQGDETVAVAPDANAPVVLVSQLAGQGVTPEEAALVTDMVRRELMATGKFRVIDRADMDKVMAQKAAQLAGLSADAETVQFGKLLNAQFTGTGSFGKLMGSYVLNFRLVSVETGEAKNAGSAEGTTLAELKKGIRKFAKDFAAR
jgi:curli biogenesis system outer membrane secretion channel CsgG